MYGTVQDWVDQKKTWLTSISHCRLRLHLLSGNIIHDCPKFKLLQVPSLNYKSSQISKTFFLGFQPSSNLSSNMSVGRRGATLNTINSVFSRIKFELVCIHLLLNLTWALLEMTESTFFTIQGNVAVNLSIINIESFSVN